MLTLETDRTALIAASGAYQCEASSRRPGQMRWPLLALIASLAVIASLAFPPSRADALYIGSGWLAGQGEWPWVAHLRDSAGGSCTGTLISPTRVLTAAHCVDAAGSEGAVAKPAAGYTVRVDRADHSNASVGATAGVSAIALHPQAYLPEREGDPHQHHAFHDIAVLFLDRAINSVPTPPIGGPGDWAASARVAGYGHYSWDMSPIYTDSRLRMADFNFLTDSQCEAVFNAQPPGNHYDRTIHACLDNPPGLTVNQVDCITHGDSGGPMMIYKDGGWKLIGVTSYYPHRKDRCHAGGPFGFAWVAGAKMRDWPLSVQPPVTDDGTGGGDGSTGGGGGGGSNVVRNVFAAGPNLAMTKSALRRHISAVIQKNTRLRPIRHLRSTCVRQSNRRFKCQLRFLAARRVVKGTLRIWNANKGGRVAMQYRFKGKRHHVTRSGANYRLLKWGNV